MPTNEDTPEQEATNEAIMVDGADDGAMAAEPAPTDVPADTPAQVSEAGEDDDKFIRFTKRVTSSAERIIGTSYKKAKSAVRSAKFEPRAGVAMLDELLDWARRTFPPTMFDALAGGLVRYGHYALMLAQVLCLLIGIVAGVKLGSIAFVVYGVGIALLLVILQYTANKFLNAGNALIQSSPSRLGSDAFLDCLSLLMEAGGILVLIWFVILAGRTGAWTLLWLGIGTWALCDAVAYVALNPSMVNVAIDSDVRAGEEAIGIMSFLVKAVVRIVPIAFGVGAVLGAIGLLAGIINLLRLETGVALERALPGVNALRFTLFCTCLPFASYVFFAFYHLMIDILRAILILPEKLDRGNGPGTLNKGE